MGEYTLERAEEAADRDPPVTFLNSCVDGHVVTSNGRRVRRRDHRVDRRRQGEPGHQGASDLPLDKLGRVIVQRHPAGRRRRTARSSPTPGPRATAPPCRTCSTRASSARRTPSTRCARPTAWPTTWRRPTGQPRRRLQAQEHRRRRVAGPVQGRRRAVRLHQAARLPRVGRCTAVTTSWPCRPEPQDPHRWSAGPASSCMGRELVSLGCLHDPRGVPQRVRAAEAGGREGRAEGGVVRRAGGVGLEGLIGLVRAGRLRVELGRLSSR